MKIRAVFLIIVLLSGCTSRQLTVPEKKDTLDFLLDLTEKIQSDTTLHQSGAADRYSAIFDSLRDNDFTLAHKYDIETLLNKINNTFVLDTVLTGLAEKEQNNLLSVSLNETRFRLLIPVQERLDLLYNNEETVDEPKQPENSNAKETTKTDKFETHGKWVFKENVSWMLVLIRENDKFSRLKTDCLYRVMNILHQLENPAQKIRAWRAIGRMIDLIDLQKSTSGYGPFQRSAHGLYTDKGVVINTLLARRDGETNKDVLAIADQVIQHVEKQLSAKKDMEFWTKVYESREMKNIARQQRKGIQIDSNSRVYDSDSLNALYWFEKGYKTQDPRQKIYFYSKAIALDPEMTEAYNNRGNVYQNTGNDTNALKDYDKAVSIDPYYAPVYLNRANNYQNRGDYDKAIQDFHSAVMFAPDNAQAWFYRGQCYKNMEQYSKAIQDFDKVQQMGSSPEYLQKAIYYSAICYLKMNELEPALSDFYRVLEFDPENVSVYIQCGDIHRKMKEYHKALNNYDAVLQIDSLNALAYNNRGLCYQKQGEFDLAVKSLEKAVNIQPEYVSAYYNLGSVYWQQRKWKQVVAAWEKCLKIDPEYTLAKKWLTKAKERTKKRYITIEVEVPE
ncbi:tetratricopeptide repeat protein [candidate division KSB1 bacterium]|nr:tetratricopeptide repeat protein [candidate division KSB1 bacterium]